MTSQKKRAVEIQESINHILFSHWDPIGINDIAPENEYASYVAGVYRLLAAGSSAVEISEHLRQVEINEIEMTTTLEHRAMVAKKLMDIDVSL